MDSFCTNCGKKLKDNQEFCTSCGKSIKSNDSNKQNSDIKEYNSFALTGFFLGLLSMFCINAYGVVGLLALIFSILGLINIKKDHTLGKGLAITGIVLGLLGILAVVIIFVI